MAENTTPTDCTDTPFSTWTPEASKVETRATAHAEIVESPTSPTSTHRWRLKGRLSRREAKQQEMQGLQNAIEIVNKRTDELSRNNNELAAGLDIVNKRIAEMEAGNEALRAELHTIKQQSTDTNRQNAVIMDKISAANALQDKLTKKNEQMRRDTEQIESTTEELSKESAFIAKEVGSLRKTLREVQSQSDPMLADLGKANFAIAALMAQKRHKEDVTDVDPTESLPAANLPDSQQTWYQRFCGLVPAEGKWQD